MKKILSILLVGLVLGASLVGCNKKGEKAKELASSPLTDSVAMNLGELVGSIVKMQEKDSTFDKAAFLEGFNKMINSDTAMSYMGGVQMAMQVLGQAQQLEQQGVKFDLNKFRAAFEKAVKGDTVNEAKLQELQMAFQGAAQRAVDQEMKKKADVNKKKGAEFVAKKSKEGYTKTASGLLYKVSKQGNGANFTEDDEVMVKYVGKHINGKEFDNSKGEAVPFNLKHVIPGFAEMLKLMKPGMEVEVIIPGDLAYGDRGTGDIEPGETLVFKMETVGVKPAEKDKPAAPAPGKPLPVKPGKQPVAQ